MQPYSNNNPDFPFCTNVFYAEGLADLQNQQQLQQGYVAINPNHPVDTPNMLNSPTIASLFEKQSHEIDNFIKILNDQMKVVLQNQKVERVDLLRRIKAFSQQILIRKNEELARVAMQKQELQNHIRKLEVEKMKLKMKAEERELMALTLQCKLEEEKKKMKMVANDVESYCGENEEARSLKRARHGNKMVCCTRCNTNTPNILFLPCRHVASCNVCETLLEACLICGMEKKNTIEIQSSI